MPRQSVTPELLRAWWAHKQGLLEPLASATPAVVLARAGWARSVAGAGPYLTLHARAGLSREAVDAAVAAVEIHELPAARSCTYVLPTSDYALALTLAAAAGDGEMKLALKLGVTQKEVDALCDAVLLALKNGPAEPDRIRATVGPKARSLGAERTEKGPRLYPAPWPSTACRSPATSAACPPMATWTSSATAMRSGNLTLKHSKLSPAEAYTALARLYFQWIGPATLAEFQWFSGLGVKDRRGRPRAPRSRPSGHRLRSPAFPPGPRRPVVLQAPRRPRLPPRLEPRFPGPPAPRPPHPPGPRRPRPFPATRPGQSLPLGLSDLPCHALLDRGRLVGLWDYDPASESIVCFNFIQRNKDLDAAIKNTEDYVRIQLGDARSFSLDSPKSRVRRLAALRQAAG